MEKTQGKLIFTAYHDENNNIRLGIAPEFDGYTNGREYFINLGDTLIKMVFEISKRLEAVPPNKQQQEE